MKILEILKEILHESNVEKMLTNKAKATGISKTILRQVYEKGLAAWKRGHRPGASQHQWATARINSFVTGKGGARKADASLWKKAKKSKNK
jgi:Lhr-like helicase